MSHHSFQDRPKSDQIDQYDQMEREAMLYEMATLIYEQLKVITAMMARLAGEEQEAIKEPHRGDVL